MSKASKKNDRTPFYTFARGVAWLLMHTLFPVKVVGYEKLGNLEAPYILIGNHDSGMDPIAVAHIVKKHEIHFIAKKELMKNRFFNWILGTLLHAIPVDRHGSDMMAMRNALKVLKDGNVLGIFPEGTRYKKGLMKELEGGVAIMALRGRVPLVPMYITSKLRLFHLTQIVVGDVIDVAELAEKGVDKTVCDELLTQITNTYATLEKEYSN